MPRVFLIARVDEQDVALAHVGGVLYHLARVHVVIVHFVGDIRDDRIANEFVERHALDVPAAGDEVFFTVEMSSSMVHELDFLAIDLLRVEAFLVPDFRVVIGRPRRSVLAPRLRQVVHLVSV